MHVDLQIGDALPQESVGAVPAVAVGAMQSEILYVSFFAHVYTQV
jgi:hypothetical protein